MAKNEKLSRRVFVKRLSAGAAVTASLLHPAFPALAESKKSTTAFHLRTLGRTGMQYTPLGFGSMRTSDPAVIRKAIDMGVNNIDTARVYMDGQNEIIVGQAIKGVRNSIFLTTKIKLHTKKKMLKDAEKSLKALGTDHVDTLLLHSMKQPSDIENQDALEVLQQLKKQGKIRFAGFSTHRNMAANIRASLKNKFFDVILVAYNFKSDHDLGNAIKEAAAANIGVIAMKTQAGGYKDDRMKSLNPHQAALKWVLSNENITAAIPSMITFEQLEENFAAVSNKMGWLDRKTLDRYSQVIDNQLCRLCSACEGQCPHGVSVSDVNRCTMYADAYEDYELALTNYNDLAASEKITSCIDCNQCVVHCAHGLDLTAKMKRAVVLFA